MNTEERMTQRAQDALAAPLYRRAYAFEEIDPDIVDSRATDALGARKEMFALSMSDFFLNNRLSETLPLMAWEARRSNSPGMIERVHAQLRQMTTWVPLQRPGYTLYRPGEPPTPDYNDGSWLATGVGVWAIVETLRIAGDIIPYDLKSSLDSLLEEEIARIFDDYRIQRQWFTKGNGAPSCNQWVLPLCGLVEAAVHLGTFRSTHAGAYETAVAKLNRSLDTQGVSGDFVEGFSYASLTLINWIRAARVAAAAGDDRLASHPYLPKFARWLGQMILPDNWTINVCDCRITHLDETRYGSLAELTSELVAVTSSPESAWLCERIGFPDSLIGIEAERIAASVSPSPPPTTAYMQALGVIAWRTGWADTDHAVWIRTSGGLPSHTHADGAHVSVIRSGQPILIEAGTPVYGHTDIGRSFASAAGHNVLQIGTEWPEAYMLRRDIEGWQLKDTPVRVDRCSIDETGGIVEMLIDPSGYAGLRRWARACRWNADADITIDDDVVLDSEAIVLFRFHLGSEGRIVSADDNQATVSVGTSAMRMSANRDIDIELVPWPGANEEVGDNQCIVVQTISPTDALKLTTVIAAE